MGAHMNYARTLRMPRRCDNEMVQELHVWRMNITAAIETFQPFETFQLVEMFRPPSSRGLKWRVRD